MWFGTTSTTVPAIRLVVVYVLGRASCRRPKLEVRRYELPNIRALNFVIVGLLGEGVASSVRLDPQAKGLGEYLRAKVVDVPVSLLEG